MEFKASKIFSCHFAEDSLKIKKKLALLENVKLGKKKNFEVQKSKSLSTSSGLQYIKTYKSDNFEII